MTAGKRPLNYTTTIRAEKTANECLELLGAHGASAVAITYDDKQPSGISFLLATPHGPREFRLPVNVGGMHKSLLKARVPARYNSTEQARRVAWRVAKDWLEAQLAIVEAQMATLDEAFLPYLQVESGQTLYEAYREREALALEAGGAR
jgi:hypothetical protein